jgi:hypothetical protein
MDAVPWHLANRLVQYLENPEAIFEYLHLTEFFRARAAMLALKGKVLNQAGLHTALSKYQVQVGGIYRYHLIRTARTFLEKHNLAQLPECDIHDVDPFHGPKQVEKNRELLHCVIQTADFDFLATLNFLSVANELHEEIANHPLGFWVKGAGKPDVVFVAVQVQKTDYGYDVMPPPDEVKRLTRERRLVQMYSVRKQEELPLWDKPVGSEVPVGSQQLAEPTDKTADTAGRPQVKVIGDFRAIILPHEQKAIPLVKKYKTRAFLRFIHNRLTEHGTSEFYIEEIRDAYNAQLPQNLVTRQWRSDRCRDDLFGKIKWVFDHLFETLDKGTGHYRLRVSFLTPEMALRRG